jgi:uncharacterized protein (UPF0548 family)
VELSGITLGRRSPQELRAALDAAGHDALSYGHVGSTVDGRAPSTVPERVFTREAVGTLAAARAALRAWAPHRGIHAAVEPADAPLVEGTTLLVVAPFGPFELLAPDRIVAVIDEQDRFGFAYGTLAGHAEVGEELFLAELVATDRLRLTIRIHAGPGTRLARIASPLVSFFQRAAARRYLRSWAAVIEEEP